MFINVSSREYGREIQDYLSGQGYPIIATADGVELEIADYDLERITKDLESEFPDVVISEE